MQNYQIVDSNKYSATGFDFSEEDRNRLLDPALNISNLPVKRIFAPQYEPPAIPAVAISVEAGTNINNTIPDGVPPDYISIGTYNFVSLRVKTLFDQYNVTAYYSDAVLTHNDQEFQYFLFVPELRIDCIDRNKSKFLEELDDPEPIRIGEIKILVLDQSKLTNEPPLFSVGGTSQSIYLLRNDIADELQKIGVAGMSIKSIEGAQWMF